MTRLVRVLWRRPDQVASCVIVVVVIVVAVLIGLARLGGTAGPHVVALQASSDGGSLGSVTYGPSGSTSQNTAPPDPWSASWRTSGTASASMVAQNGGDGGAVRCSITVDGTVVDQHASTGAYAVVTCSYAG